MKFFSIENYQKTRLPLAVFLSSPRPMHDPPHMHDCREFVLVKDGCGWCAVNNTRYPIIRGDLYIMDSSDVHEFYIEKRLCLYNIMFRETFYSFEEQKCFRSLFKLHGKYTFLPHVFERLFTLLNEIERELKQNNPDSMIYAKSMFLCFLITVTRNIDFINGETALEHNSDTSRVLDYLHKHCNEKISLSDLVGICGNSAEYAGRRFKQLTGVNFCSYIKNYRISCARNLLECSSLSISEIAYKLGWFDLAHFDKDFRKILGMTPADYRKFIQPKNR